MAYACEPHAGSEPGVGWNLVKGLAKFHDVLVVTRRNNQPRIERELIEAPVQGLTFAYHDPPHWLTWWKRGGRGVHAYSYLWHLTAIRLIKKLHEVIGFDVAHHVTFVKYWAPSSAAFVGVPFVWGPVGGGDGLPRGFSSGLSSKSRFTEYLRVVAQRLSHLDPLLRATARRSALALGATDVTCDCLVGLGARKARRMPSVALDSGEIEQLRRARTRARRSDGFTEFISIGRLEGWKGVHLTLRAFARARPARSRLRIVGDGPERGRLEHLSRSLGISQNVTFVGALARPEALRLLADSDVLVQASLHDSGGWVSLEAMACGLPVIALARGGPSLQVTEQTGVPVPVVSELQVIDDLARAMTTLSAEPDKRAKLGEGGHERILSEFTWEARVRAVSAALEEAAMRESS